MKYALFTTLALCAAMSLSAADAPYSCKVGDKVEGWNISWYKATVVEVGSGEHAGYCFLKWDKYSTNTWIALKNIRPQQTATKTDAPSNSAELPITKYVCGVFLSGRFTYTQSVVLNRDGAYQSSSGASGRYSYDAKTERIEFSSGSLKDQFGRYEPGNNRIFRLTSKADTAKSSASQNWRSQVCSPQK